MDKHLIIQHGRQDANSNAESQHRHDILMRNKEMIEAHLQKLRGQDIAVLIAELTGDMDFLPSDVQKFVMDSNAQNVTPTQIVGVPRWQLYKALTKFQKALHRDDPRDPKVSPVVEQLQHPAPAGSAHVVVLAKRGKSIAQIAIPD